MESAPTPTPCSQDAFEGEAAPLLGQGLRIVRAWEAATDPDCPGPGLAGSAPTMSGHLGLLQARPVCCSSKPSPGTQGNPSITPTLVQGIEGLGIQFSQAICDPSLWPGVPTLPREEKLGNTGRGLTSCWWLQRKGAVSYSDHLAYAPIIAPLWPEEALQAWVGMRHC